MSAEEEGEEGGMEGEEGRAERGEEGGVERGKEGGVDGGEEGAVEGEEGGGKDVCTCLRGGECLQECRNKSAEEDR